MIFRLFIVTLIIALKGASNLSAQEYISGPWTKDNMLLLDPTLEIEATDAVNAMYNFKFEEAEYKFKEFQERWPDHPLPDFLFALTYWWRMMPNLESEAWCTQYQSYFLKYIDLSIDKSKSLYKADKDNPEAAFFLAAAYGFKGRLFAEHGKIIKAGSEGQNALHYLKKMEGKNALSPEFLFGDALFNYYAEWIRQEYPLLRPVMKLFPKGNKEKGLAQLEEVAHNAFYTRIEAQYFQMRIWYNEEDDKEKAYPVAKYLSTYFPDNPYFQRIHARIAFDMGYRQECQKISEDILYKITIGMPGYEATSGRYASFYLAYMHKNYYKNPAKAKEYYLQTMYFAQQSDDGAIRLNYYLYSVAELARMAHAENDIRGARAYWTTVKDNTKKGHSLHDEAVKYLKTNKLPR